MNIFSTNSLGGGVMLERVRVADVIVVFLVCMSTLMLPFLLSRRK